MTPEEGGRAAGREGAPPRAVGGDGKGCDLLARTPSLGPVQSLRAQIHQQINKELRIRAGAENLYRATSNARVRETVAQELRYVNCSLQLLKEELEELGREDGPPPQGEGAAVPMIPLGLKETRELDWSTPLRVLLAGAPPPTEAARGPWQGLELISGHFGEDGASYEAEIRELAELRQAMRTPSRSEGGLRLLSAYYTQLSFLDARFAAPSRSLGLRFHWYDSLTGLPAQQQALAFEKGSVLFNIGALHTQIAARQDRSSPAGARRAAEAFQQAAGAFGLLRDNFSHAPSPDMSPAWLALLERLMLAQAQECVFEGLVLSAPADPHDGPAQLRLAQEAAQVAADYGLVHQTMAQGPVRDHAPPSWTALALVKAEYFRALAHYHTALALCDGAGECPLATLPDPAVAEAELPLQQVFLGAPGQSTAPHPTLPQEPEERRRLGKAHLRRAVLGQEEACRLHAAGRALRRVDPLQAVLAQALRRALTKHAELDREDDFSEAPEAPDIQPKTHQRPAVRTPSFSQAKAADIFHRLGPLSLFSAKNRWRLVGPVHVARGEDGFGFTLRGDAPVLIAAVAPGGPAAAAGLQRGDYIVALDGQPCKWWRHAEVVARLRAAGAEGVSLQVATLLSSAEPPCRLQGDRWPALGRLLRSQKGCTWAPPTPAQPATGPQLGWGRKARRGKSQERGPLPHSPSGGSPGAPHTRAPCAPEARIGPLCSA